MRFVKYDITFETERDAIKACELLVEESND